MTQTNNNNKQQDISNTNNNNKNMSEENSESTSPDPKAKDPGSKDNKTGQKGKVIFMEEVMEITKSPILTRKRSTIKTTTKRTLTQRDQYDVQL